MEERQSLFEKMSASSANTRKDQAVFQFLREVEMLDRELGAQFQELHVAKEGVLQNVKGDFLPFVSRAMEVLYDILDAGGLSSSVRDIIKKTLKNGRNLVDVMN